MSTEYREERTITGEVIRVPVAERRDPVTFKIEAWRLEGCVTPEACRVVVWSRCPLHNVPLRRGVDGSWVMDHGTLETQPDLDGNLSVTWTP